MGYDALKITDAINDPMKICVVTEELCEIVKCFFNKIHRKVQSKIVGDIFKLLEVAKRMNDDGLTAALDRLKQIVQRSHIKTKKKLRILVEFKKLSILMMRRSSRLGGGANAEIYQEELHGDPLINVFERLDVHTIAICAGVCRSWRHAARDPYLWEFLYNRDVQSLGTEGPPVEESDNWMITYQQVYQEQGWANILNSKRAYCTVCKVIIFVSDIHMTHCLEENPHTLLPLSNEEVAKYVGGELQL